MSSVQDSRAAANVTPPIIPELKLSLPQDLETDSFNLFLTALNTNLDINKHNLTAQNIAWIKGFIQVSPDALKQAVDEINKIKSCSFDLHDIPHIISIISNIYHTTFLKKDMENPENIIVLVQLTLNTLIDSNLVPLPNVEKQVIEFVIDKSFDLLNMNLGFLRNEAKICCGNRKWCF